MTHLQLIKLSKSLLFSTVCSFNQPICDTFLLWAIFWSSVLHVNSSATTCSWVSYATDLLCSHSVAIISHTTLTPCLLYALLVPCLSNANPAPLPGWGLLHLWASPQTYVCTPACCGLTNQPLLSVTGCLFESMNLLWGPNNNNQLLSEIPSLIWPDIFSKAQHDFLGGLLF